MKNVDNSGVLGFCVACFCGILLSLYALMVEIRKHRNPKYVAACDINDHVSCSRVLTSPYSKGFGVVRYLLGEQHMLNVPNCVIGLVFYVIQLALVMLPFSWATQLSFLACVVACIGSVYLAYILAFVLHDLCIVCCATYIVNAYMLYSVYHRSHLHV